MDLFVFKILSSYLSIPFTTLSVETSLVGPLAHENPLYININGLFVNIKHIGSVSLQMGSKIFLVTIGIKVTQLPRNKCITFLYTCVLFGAYQNILVYLGNLWYSRIFIVHVMKFFKTLKLALTILYRVGLNAAIHSWEILISSLSAIVCSCSHAPATPTPSYPLLVPSTPPLYSYHLIFP